MDLKEIKKAFCGISILFTGFIMISCGNTKINKSEENVSISGKEEMGIEDSINHSIAWIDSIITDIPYPSMSTIDDVTSITGEKEIESSEMGKTYHEADSIWNEFKVLCSKKEYRKAYDLYYNDKGAFMVALKSTTAQYVFYTEVLNELDRKYDPTHALENMVSNLNLNILMTSAIIQLSEGKTIPPHFSELFMMCIEGNKRTENMSKVNEIIETYSPIICQIEGKSENEINHMIEAILEE